MDTRYSPYQDVSSGNSFLNKKVFIIGAGVVLFFVIGVMIFFMTRTVQPIQENPPDIPVVVPSVTIAPLQTDPVVINEVTTVTQSFVASMNTGDIQATALNNIDSAIEQERKDNLIAFLEKEKQLFSQDGTYDPAIAPNGIQVAGDEAQVILEETINGQLVTIRRDLIKTTEGWKIADTAYNKPLDLKEKQEAKTLEETLTKDAQYRHTPQTYPLPNGDKLEIFRTYWSEKGNPYANPGQYATTAFNEIDKYDFLQYQDFLYYVPDAQQDYTVVLFDAPYVRVINNLRYDDPSGSYGKYHSFDIREIEGDVRKAVLLIYEGSVLIDRTQPGAPSGWVLSVPIAVEP